MIRGYVSERYGISHGMYHSKWYDPKPDHGMDTLHPVPSLIFPTRNIGARAFHPALCCTENLLIMWISLPHFFE